VFWIEGVPRRATKAFWKRSELIDYECQVFIREVELQCSLPVLHR